MPDGWIENAAIFGVLCCVVPFIAAAFISVWALRRADKLLMPDDADLRAQYERLRAANPNANTEQFIRQIIQRQAIRAGVVGALTSVGGFFVLPFGLTIDMLWSARIQSTTLQFIAWAHGIRNGVGEEGGALNFTQALSLRNADIQRVTLTSALTRVPSFSQRITRQIVMLLVEKTFAKLIPGIGLMIGFGVNYLIARGISEAAARWYAHVAAERGNSAAIPARTPPSRPHS